MRKTREKKKNMKKFTWKKYVFKERAKKKYEEDSSGFEKPEMPQFLFFPTDE